MKRFFNVQQVDFVLLGSTLALTGMGILIIRSATAGGAFARYPGRQAYFN